LLALSPTAASREAAGDGAAERGPPPARWQGQDQGADQELSQRDLSMARLWGKGLDLELEPFKAERIRPAAGLARNRFGQPGTRSPPATTCHRDRSTYWRRSLAAEQDHLAS